MKREDSNEAFTIMELLAVIAIVSILGALVVPSLNGLITSGGFNSAVNDLSETLDLARQAAVSRDTYVWIALAGPTTPSDSQLSVLVVASTDGTNPFGSTWSTSTTVTLPNAGFFVLTKPTSYQHCQFIEAGALTTQNISTLPAAGTSANALSSSLSFTTQSPSGSRTYNRVMEFTPSGLAYNGPNPAGFVEFGIQPAALPTAMIGKNVALLRVPFITGMTQLYRP